MKSHLVVTCSILTLSGVHRFSIHARQQATHREAVAATMPMPVAGCPSVYHCGFSSKDSFGSAAYLIVRSEGNVLVDSPRFDRQLLKQIQVRVFPTNDWSDHFKPVSSMCTNPQHAFMCTPSVMTLF